MKNLIVQKKKGQGHTNEFSWNLIKVILNEYICGEEILFKGFGHYFWK
jgi:hypothetical protein